MKRKLLCSLLAAGMFSATSANAAVTSITSAEIQSYAQAVVSYLQSVNYTISGVTSADLQTASQMYQSLASAPASQLTPWITATNNILQSSAACGSMGTYPSLNETSFSACLTDIATALANTGAPSMDGALVAALALVKAAGFPLTIYGTNVTIPTTPITPTIPPGTTPAKVISEVITPQIQRATSIQQASIISNVVSNIFSSRAPNAPGAPVRVSLGNQTGMAAGNEAPKLNAWVNVADTTIGSSAAASLFDGKVSNAIGGVDYMVSSNFVAGVSLGYDKVDLNFNFAAGSGLNSSGWMLAPYASYQINDMLSVDGTLGYASGDVDSRSPNRIDTVSYTRDFVALNLNATRWMGDLQFTGKVNYIAANEKVAMTNKMEQVRLSGQVGYWMDGIMPYLSVAYVQDLKVTSGGLTPANLDKDAWVATVGANLFSKGAVYGGIAYTEEFGRTDAKNYTFMANVGYRF